MCVWRKTLNKNIEPCHMCKGRDIKARVFVKHGMECYPIPKPRNINVAKEP